MPVLLIAGLLSQYLLFPLCPKAAGASVHRLRGEYNTSLMHISSAFGASECPESDDENYNTLLL
ncbi:MAG: hypothetical protein IJQ71_03765 [Clostridia bacterium]|nr:hypothetical protein [Clostridia bacterium]